MTFSVVIPVYNVAPYLCQCLESLQAQTFGDWEALCIDDGSTDKSGRMLDRFAARDGRFKVFHVTNAGVSAARNFALDRIRGDYVCFLDSDDALKPNALERLSEVCEQTKADFVHFGHRSVKDIAKEMCVEEQASGVVSVYHRASRDERRKAFERCFWRTWAWNVCYKTNVICDVRFRQMVMCEDICFAVDAFFKAQSVVVIDDVLYLYRARVDSASHWVSIRHFADDMESFQLTFKKVREDEHYRDYREAAFRIVRMRIYEHVSNAYHYKGEESKLAWKLFYDRVGPVLLAREFAPMRWRSLFAVMIGIGNGWAFKWFFIKPMNALDKFTKLRARIRLCGKGMP